MLITQFNFRRGDCCRGCRWLDRKFCGIQILIIKVDGIDVKILPVLISFELKGWDAALSTKVEDAHIASIQANIVVGGLSNLIEDKTIL